MKKNYSLIFLFVILILNFACVRPDITPAYLILTVEEFKDCIDVSDYNSIHDKNYDPKELNAIKQQNFTDVLVSLNGKQLGYFQLPCTIPLLPNYSGKDNIKVIPCVRPPLNATTSTLQYLFLTHPSTDPSSGLEEFFDMKKEGEYRLSAFKFKYLSSVDFPILETFTQSTDFQPRVPNVFPAAMEIFYDEELNKDIGRITLTDTAKFFDVVTSYTPLQGKGERQFWEISYKTINGKMYLSLNFENTVSGWQTQSMAVLPSTEGVWKKAYIDITDMIMQASNIASIVSTRLQITGIRNQASIDSYYYFENVKLITMPAPYY